MSGRYEGGTAVYDVIRDTLRDGQSHTVANLAKATGYSPSYIRYWLGEMSDVVKVCTQPAFQYRLRG